MRLADQPMILLEDIGAVGLKLASLQIPRVDGSDRDRSGEIDQASFDIDLLGLGDDVDSSMNDP